MSNDNALIGLLSLLELDEYMPEPKFCIFCASPIFIRKDEYEDNDEDEFY